MDSIRTEKLHKSRLNKKLVEITFVNGEPFRKLFPEMRNGFENYIDAYKAVIKEIGTTQVRILTKKVPISSLSCYK